jgi:hypothetical protein
MIDLFSILITCISIKYRFYVHLSSAKLTETQIFKDVLHYLKISLSSLHLHHCSLQLNVYIKSIVAELI